MQTKKEQLSGSALLLTISSAAGAVELPEETLVKLWKIAPEQKHGRFLRIYSIFKADIMRAAYAVNTAAVYVAAPEEWKSSQCD